MILFTYFALPNPPHLHLCDLGFRGQVPPAGGGCLSNMPGQEISPGGLKSSLGSPGQLSQGDVTDSLPLLPQSAFSQLRLTPGLRKVLFATALGTVALALAAHQLKRRRRKKKQVGPEMGGEHLGTVPLPILMARKVPSVKKGRCEVMRKGEPEVESQLGSC